MAGIAPVVHGQYGKSRIGRQYATEWHVKGNANMTMLASLKRAPAPALCGLFLMIVAGCGSISQEGSTLNKAVMGTSKPPPAIDLDKFKENVKCPPLSVHPGTETHVVYADQDISAYSVRYQATIADTATECFESDGNMVIKIGVRGRLLAGPKRDPGEVPVPLPIRVAVTQDGDNVLFSELYTIDSGLADGVNSKPWAKVIENITVPDSGVLRVIIGFDDKDARQRDG